MKEGKTMGSMKVTVSSYLWDVPLVCYFIAIVGFNQLLYTHIDKELQSTRDYALRIPAWHRAWCVQALQIQLSDRCLEFSGSTFWEEILFVTSSCHSCFLLAHGHVKEERPRYQSVAQRWAGPAWLDQFHTSQNSLCFSYRWQRQVVVKRTSFWSGHLASWNLSFPHL